MTSVYSVACLKRPNTERPEVALTVEAAEGQVPEGEGACPVRQRAGWEWEPAAACEGQGWGLRPGAVDPRAAVPGGC